MPSFQSPRGTRDILPDQQPIWQYVQRTAHANARQMGFLPITVPTYEQLDVFQRSIGEGTDVIDKELFLVRGRKTEETESYALRPEGTAGIVRSFIQHGMQTWPQPVKLYSLVNLFRYDRPQKGRYREHIQYDLEYFGDKGPFADAWVIYASFRFLTTLGLQGLQLKLNTLGTKEERAAYRKELVDYFTPLKERLSQDSQQRLQTNPLRILDSKEEIDRALLPEAPRFDRFLSPETNKHFQEVQDYLQAWKIPFLLDPYLVRGLDYYNHTAFEWVVSNREGQQNSLGGGGRYDGLLPQLDGPDCGAVGTGIGLDRVIEELIEQGIEIPHFPNNPEVFLITADLPGKEYLPEVTNLVLEAGLRASADPSRESLGSQMKAASKLQAQFAIILGQSEKEKRVVTLRNLQDGSQEEISLDVLTQTLLSRLDHASESSRHPGAR